MFWYIKQYFIRKRRLKVRMADMRREHTGRTALLLVATATMAWLLVICVQAVTWR